MNIARHLLAVLIVLGASSAVAQPSDKARIEQAYAARLEAMRRADIDQRIAARWPALAQDPAMPVIGNPNADVTIVEFSDYNCPYCKAMEPRLAALLKADRKVKLVTVEFPILTPASMTGTRAALAAMRQGKNQNNYAAFHQALMRFEGNLTDADVFDVAKSVGLDVARLKKDMAAPQVSDRIIANYNLARGIRVVQTPAVIVGGPAGVHIMGSESAAIDFPKAVAAARRR
jgi:protein-disulfide isomerase